ncbi:MAG: hypothetical protein ACREA0_21960, partial [bacterium]
MGTNLEMPFARFQRASSESPIVATAVHIGHAVRPEVEKYMALDAATRLRKEDPTSSSRPIVQTLASEMFI